MNKENYGYKMGVLLFLIIIAYYVKESSTKLDSLILLSERQLQATERLWHK